MYACGAAFISSGWCVYNRGGIRICSRLLYIYDGCKRARAIALQHLSHSRVVIITFAARRVVCMCV
jgi:hypothetical protein